MISSLHGFRRAACLLVYSCHVRCDVPSLVEVRTLEFNFLSMRNGKIRNWVRDNMDTIL